MSYCTSYKNVRLHLNYLNYIPVRERSYFLCSLRGWRAAYIMTDEPTECKAIIRQCPNRSIVQIIIRGTAGRWTSCQLLGVWRKSIPTQLDHYIPVSPLLILWKNRDSTLTSLYYTHTISRKNVIYLYAIRCHQAQNSVHELVAPTISY